MRCLLLRRLSLFSFEKQAGWELLINPAVFLSLRFYIFNIKTAAEAYANNVERTRGIIRR